MIQLVVINFAKKLAVDFFAYTKYALPVHAIVRYTRMNM